MVYLGDKLRELARVLDYGIARQPFVAHMSDICVGKGKAIVSNGYVIIEAPFDSNNFEGYIKGGMFVDSVKLLPPDSFEVTVSKNKLRISNGKIDLYFVKVGEYDSSKVITGEGVPVSIPNDVFNGINQVLNFTGIKEILPALRGVSVKQDSIIASDNVRIAYVSFSGFNSGSSILMPFEAASSLVAVAANRVLQDVCLLQDRNLLCFRFTDGVLIYTSLLGLDYPDVDRFIKSVEGSVIDIPAGFVDGVQRVYACQEGVDRLLHLKGSGMTLVIDSGEGVCRYVEQYALSRVLQVDIDLTLSVEAFLGIVEKSRSMFISEDNILYFYGKQEGTKYAIMPIEV